MALQTWGNNEAWNQSTLKKMPITPLDPNAMMTFVSLQINPGPCWYTRWHKPLQDSSLEKREPIAHHIGVMMPLHFPHRSPLHPVYLQKFSKMKMSSKPNLAIHWSACSSACKKLGQKIRCFFTNALQASAVATPAPATALDATAKGAAAEGAQEATVEAEVRLHSWL